MELLRKLNAPLAIGVQVGNIGVIFRFLERLDEALDCFLQSEAALRDAGERHGLTRTLGHIADLYIVLEHFDQAQGYATESLDLANRANDRLAISRGEQLLGHMAMFQKKYAEALGHYERTVAAERELKRMIELALALAFCTLCRVEIGQAEAALRDINEASLILGSVTVRKASPGFLLTACQAKVQFALGQREQAALTLKEALEKANRDNLGHYSSDMVLLMAWQAIDALRAAGLGDPNTAHEIRVQCEHCHARVRGTRKHVDDLIACPACKTAPFRYFVGE
jgi:tetratricopeptide (TPR) repeat protein